MKQPKKKRDLFETVTSVYLFLLLTVFLFYGGTEGYQNITKAKFQAFCLICGGYLVVMAVLAVERFLVGDKKPLSPGEVFRRSSWVQRFVFFYLVFTWVSALVSPYLPETVIGASRYEGALTISIYCISFLLVSVYGRADRYLLGALGLSVALFGVLCIFQLAGWNPLGLYPKGYGYEDAGTAYAGAYLGTIGNVDLVAAFFSLTVPVFWVAVLRGKGRWRFALLAPLGIALYVLCRMSVMAGYVGVGASVLLSLPVVVPAGRKGRCLLAALVAGFAAAAVILLYWFDPGVGMLHELHEILHGNFDSAFGSGRLHIWNGVLQKCWERPLLGTGPDTMLYGGIEAFTRYDARLGQQIVSQIDVAHNEYLNIFYHQGVFALAAYLGALVLLAKKWIVKSASHKNAAILGAGVLGYCIQAFFGFSMCITAPFFWAALALLEGCERQEKREDKK